MKMQIHLADKAREKATEFYNERYNNVKYLVATEGKTNTYCNKLIDEAMALCGSPFYKISNRQWSEQALNFLGLFA